MIGSYIFCGHIYYKSYKIYLFYYSYKILFSMFFVNAKYYMASWCSLYIFLFFLEKFVIVLTNSSTNCNRNCCLDIFCPVTYFLTKDPCIDTGQIKYVEKNLHMHEMWILLLKMNFRVEQLKQKLKIPVPILSKRTYSLMKLSLFRWMEQRRLWRLNSNLHIQRLKYNF